ncbi:hypothetical protein DICVIV_13601 [Dictyocaulus viviparus]|uniref:Uncharacterized protein n=1 Tax=Dictyocaulus viviparus TaxID=29172 RepID=A0A0D8X9Y2_DICVI|nr:hypothetical protein DICVIV_13601 [Dictyocaulus viviparus]
MTITNTTVHLNRNFCQRQLDHVFILINFLNLLVSDCSYALLILLKCGAEVEATGPISLFTHHQVRIRQLTFAEHVQICLFLKITNSLVPRTLQISVETANNKPTLSHRLNNFPCDNDSSASEFLCCGHVILNRDTVGTNKFYLDEAEYPLEGTIEVYARSTTLPPAIEVDNRGFLAVFRRAMVYFWRYRDDESLDKRPIASMDLTKCTNIVVACNAEQCPRSNSFSIDMLISTTPSSIKKKRYFLI